MRVHNFLVILAALTVAHGSKISVSKNGLHADLMDFEALISLDSLQSILLVHSNNDDVKNVTNYLSSKVAIDAKKAVLRIPEMKSIMNWIQDNYDNYMPEHNINASTVAHNIATKPSKVSAGVAPAASHIVSAGTHKAPAGVHKVPAEAHQTPGHNTPAVSHNSAAVTHNAAVAHNVPSAVAKKTPGKVKKVASSPKKKNTADLPASKIPKKKIAKKISSRSGSNGYNAYMEDMIDVVPMDEVKQLIHKKLEQNGPFAKFYKRMHEIEKPFKKLIELPEVATFVHNLKELGVDPVKPWEFFKDFFDWK